MKRTPTRTKTIINLMHDPDPRFVSLVKHGANQRPFHITKSAQKEGAMPRAKKKTGATKSPVPATKINRIQFTRADFENMDAVQDFLTEKGYSDFEITELESGDYEVVDNPADAFEGNLREVQPPSTKGVTYFVGTLKDAGGEGEDDADEADDEAGEDGEDEGDKGEADDTKKSDDKDGKQPAPSDDKPEADPTKTDKPEEAKPETAPVPDDAKKAADPAPRKRERKGLLTIAGSGINAYVGDCERFADTLTEKQVTAKSFGESVAEYTGGTPPGMYVLTDALNTELRKMLKAGRADETKLAALASEFGRGVMALASAYENIISAATAKAAKSADPAEDAAVEAMLNLMFGGAPGALTGETDTAKELSALRQDVAKLAEGMATMQATFDAAVVAELEAAQKAVDEIPEPRAVAGRKSVTEAEVAEDEDAVTDEEQAENDRRAQKRLGMGGF